VIIVQEADVVLARLGAARTPWLAVALAGPAARARLAPVIGDAVMGDAVIGDAAAGDATVIDIADPQAVPLMVNPLEPGPGQVQAHADRLGGLFEAAFGLADPVTAALRAGLRRAYADGGWDLRTGWDPRAGRDPAVPSFRQVRLATVAAADELGYGPGLRSAVRGFLAARLDALWAGPAGRFLEGGHPADLARLLRGNVLVTSRATADEEAASFLAGVLLLRLAGWLSHHPAPLTVVVAIPGETGLGASPRGAAWFARLLENLRLVGADVTVSPLGAAGGAVDRARRDRARPDRARPDRAAAVPALLSGRRSAACGELCRRRPCTGYELHAADVLAEDHGQAWLRLWVQTLVLAFLTGRPVPRVPAPLRPGWQALSPRTRECLLATAVETAVMARAGALRRCYPPHRLVAVVAAAAGRMLAAGDPIPARGGPVWVIPQLRWLHEMERLNPLGHDRLRPGDLAPPLDFALAGLSDWPGIRVADRLGGLRRHPLAMESERNRAVASTALLGAGGAGRERLDADLAIAGIGISPPLRLRHAAATMGAGGHAAQPGWLEVVLSWPHRIVVPAADPDVGRTATG
jgi:hypothetical protein